MRAGLGVELVDGGGGAGGEGQREELQALREGRRAGPGGVGGEARCQLDDERKIARQTLSRAQGSQWCAEGRREREGTGDDEGVRPRLCGSRRR